MKKILVLLLLFIVFSCGIIFNKLYNVKYVLLDSNLTNNIPYIIITKDDKIVGYAGCNSFMAHIDYIEDGNIKIGTIATTKKYCENSSKIESNFLKKLNSVATYKVENNQLYFFDNHKVLLFSFQKSK